MGQAGAWEAGTAPAPNLFCREKMWVSRAGEERAEPRCEQKTSVSPLGRRGSAEQGCMDTPLHTGMLSSFPRAAALARQLLPPFSHQHKWPHPSWHQREPAGEGPHLRGRMGSCSSHGCGLGAGWAGLGPRGQYLCERARAAGKGAAWLPWLLSAGRSARC